MRATYDAIVIGTGFGGAVAACRLAQAGLKVGVIERGRRYPMGGFPRDWNNPLDGWLWPNGQGLFDIRPISEMMIVQGAGYGGGSLIYANVHLRCADDVFAHGWPAGYSRAALDPYYDLAAYMLDIKPITSSEHLGMPVKSAAMKAVADKLGRGAQFCYPNIAVDFGPPNVSRKNKFGAEQQGCTYCGECDIGCNLHAKNTLDLNYLAVAEQYGADVNTQCEVVKIDSIGNSYMVTCKDWAGGGREAAAAARNVFLCAGAVNSTELLLRCRDQFKTLPNISEHLGSGYSGNGDFLAFAYDTAEDIQPSLGPTITTGIVYDRGESGNRVWFIFEEGGYPKEIDGYFQLLNPKAGWLASSEVMTRLELERTLKAGLMAAKKPAEIADAARHSAVFLAMGRDKANGRIRLSSGPAYIPWIEWNTLPNQPLYDAQAGFAADVARALGGTLRLNPFWDRLKVPVTVHNLGGCGMADDPAYGVTNGHGEVHGYPGLYVLDGSILPAATGVNPSHTIAAVAERSVEATIRRIINNANWHAPEKAKAQPVIDPVSQVTIPAGGVMAPTNPPIGLFFTETMKGFVDKDHTPAEDFVGAERAGQNKHAYMDFTLTIRFPNLDEFLANKMHPGVADGIVHVDGFTGVGGAPVSNGLFNLFVDTNQFYERKMLYALPFYGTDGKPYLLDGFKQVKDHGQFDVWGATSTLYTVIREGHDRAGRVLATGIIHILMQDFVRQLTTFTVTGTDNPTQKAEAMGRFGNMFMGTLWDVFVRPRLP